MKKLLKLLIMVFIIVGFTNITFSTAKADTKDALIGSGIPVQIVDDIDNCPYPETTAITYSYGQNCRAKFTLDAPGQIKAIFNCQMNTRINGNAWISSDMDGKDIIGNIFNFSNTSREVSWFLGKGTYYLFDTWTNAAGEVNVALLYEKAKADNSGAGKSFQNAHMIDMKNTYNGFLTNTAPNEYYSFDLTERTAVTFKYSFDTIANPLGDIGHCSLYDGNELFITEGTYLKTDTGAHTFTYTLEKGTYYVRMNGILGNTTLSLTPMHYDITLTPDSNGSWTDEPIDVSVKTSIDFSTIIVLAKDIDSSLIDNDMVWSPLSKDAIECDGTSFTAKKSSVYSVRVTDVYGNNTMQKIKISNIDVKKPTVKGVTNGKAYRSPITVTWTDNQSGIDQKKTKLNGKPVSSGVKITKEGKYTLYIYDKMGNYTKKVFYIDKTAPTAGVTNGKTYSDTVNLKFKDNLSGIKMITIDGIEQPSGFTSLYLYQDGDYTIKLWDNAGNSRTVHFRISKKY